MQVTNQRTMTCPCCMNEHPVSIIQTKEHDTFKGVPVSFNAEYYYCDKTEEILEDEKMIRRNDIAMKDAYRKEMGLLTSDEILDIRKQYDISQTDLCKLLGWGAKTVARYEGHQVQDRAHDMILRKITDDPEWFLELIESSKTSLSKNAYHKSHTACVSRIEHSMDRYLAYSIFARYIPYADKPNYNGGKKLSLDIVTDMIRYFSNSPQVSQLYKVKLMKLLWYSDALSYKRRGIALSGLVYQALPMGAVPIAYESIIELSRITYEELDLEFGTACHFLSDGNSDFPSLTQDDKKILDAVIQQFGNATKNEIVSYMHQEDAYLKTDPCKIIDFRWANHLHIQ